MRFMLKQEKRRADMKKDFPLLSLQEQEKARFQKSVDSETREGSNGQQLSDCILQNHRILELEKTHMS